MSKRGDKEFLYDIQESIERIIIYTAEMDYEKFLSDIKTQDAVIRNIEIIGEATKNLTGDFIERHPEIDWKQMAGMRDKIIHFYFGIKWDVVWDVIKNKFPPIKEEIKSIIGIEKDKKDFEVEK